jgi:hypothetical protein
MKKIIALTLALTLSILTACNKDDTEERRTPTEAPEPPTTAEPPPTDDEHLLPPIFTQLQDFFEPDLPSPTFALVKVTGYDRNMHVTPYPEEIEYWWQLATAQVIETVSGENSTAETISIHQVFIGRFDRLLNDSATYLLPLVYNDIQEDWNIIGDADVLFEINDDRVKTNARGGNFAEFDGESAAQLIAAIRELAEAKEYGN